ncbi:hypothetical protein GALMADRAFT_80425 [Galerina marginata CBS 339.88]|uniref:C3H1-type domain-containing protein n=1 Tax=Galerina marginata (strain CBS 339.88) TaxID=685588 RepID=A0A067SA19_GALM3|nr:hypothetical protein GALMADRAFT_80425 [Galerina marginata CBS 339.88]
MRESTSQSHPKSLDIVKLLDSIVEDFRNKQFTKSQTIVRLSSTLCFSPEREEPEKAAALIQYLTAIDSIEKLSVEAAQRGLHAAAGLSEQPIVSNANVEQVLDPQDDTWKTGTKPNEESQAFIRSFVQSRKRRERSVSSDEEDAIEQVNDTGDTSNKKIRLFEKDMPWFDRESAARRSANPSCVKTREILTVFARDYNAVKQWIIIAHTAPCGFPPVEWENIIKGRPVSLDNVLSSLHHISPIKENIGRVGSTEISLGRTEPTRKVKTSGEWTSAWNATIKATMFAFPHREDELREYGDYMDREFSSKVVSAHRKLIIYDEAVRGEVGGGQRILLTDRSHFSYIYSAIVLPDGIESEFGNSATNSKGSKSQIDICRRYNSKAKCPNTASTCRYRHICGGCKQPGHSKPDCPSGEGKASQKSSSQISPL